MHVGEAVDKEAGRLADDVMCRLEEGDEAPLGLNPLDLAEADEGVHLVDVAAHGLGEIAQAADEWVGLVVDRAAIVLQAKKQRVEEREAFGVRMADDGARA